MPFTTPAAAERAKVGEHPFLVRVGKDRDHVARR
jgi:hypothetical protein